MAYKLSHGHVTLKGQTRDPNSRIYYDSSRPGLHLTRYFSYIAPPQGPLALSHT